MHSRSASCDRAPQEGREGGRKGGGKEVWVELQRSFKIFSVGRWGVLEPGLPVSGPASWRNGSASSCCCLGGCSPRVNKMGASVCYTTYHGRSEKVGGAEDNTGSCGQSGIPSRPLYWEGQMGHLGNAFDLRCLAKIPTHMSPLGFPPELSREQSNFC